MPRGDGTGPARAGPMTGRAMGLCAGYPAPGYATPQGFWGRGPGGGGRGGRNLFFATGMRWWQRSPVAPADAVVPQAQVQLETLKNQAQYFQEALNGIHKRIEELEGSVPKR